MVGGGFVSVLLDEGCGGLEYVDVVYRHRLPWPNAIVRRMLRHHAQGRPVRPRLHVSRSAVPAVSLVGDARHALITAEPVDQRCHLEHGVMAAAVAPTPNVEALSGHVAEGRGTVVRRSAHVCTIRRSGLPTRGLLSARKRTLQSCKSGIR